MSCPCSQSGAILALALAFVQDSTTGDDLPPVGRRLGSPGTSRCPWWRQTGWPTGGAVCWMKGRLCSELPRTQHLTCRGHIVYTNHLHAALQHCDLCFLPGLAANESLWCEYWKMNDLLSQVQGSAQCDRCRSRSLCLWAAGLHRNPASS